MGRRWLRRAAAALLLVALAGHATAGPGGALVVRVQAENKAYPLGGAEVVVWNADRTWAAKTGADGSARFTDLPAGAVTVYAAAEEHTASEREDVLVGEAAEATVTLALGPGVPFDGTALDDEGKPVARAEVVVEAGGAFEGAGRLVPPEHPPYARTATDAKGRFHVRGIPPESFGTVVVRAKGRAEPRVGVRATGGKVQPSPLEIRLAPGGLVRGTVRDPAGKPFPGAAVFVVPAGEAELRASPRQVFLAPDKTRTVRALTAFADADGMYVIEGLPLGEDLVVAAEGDPVARSAWMPLALDAEHVEPQVDLKLRRHAILILRMQDASGTPIGDADVSFDSPTLAPKPKLAGLGRLEFGGMWPGEHGVRITKAGYRDVHRRVTLVEGQVHEFEILLEPAVAVDARLSGTVKDAAGKARARHGYQVQRPAPNTPGGWAEVLSFGTKADGTFAVSVAPGRYRVVFAAVRGGAAEVLAEVEVKAGETRTLTLAHSR